MPSPKKLSLKLPMSTSQFPVEVLNNWELESLEIIGGNFTYFPEDISILKNLKFLSLVSTKVKILPKEIFKLPKLQYLNLKNNEISHFPTLSTTSLIKSLILGRNILGSNESIQSNDKIFSFLPYLETLDLGHNQLSFIPSSLSLLKNLKRLNLDSNRLTHIPDFIKNSKSLTHLSIDNNFF